MKKVRKFIKKVLITTLIFSFIALILILLQYYFHCFDSLISYINQDISKVNSTLSAELLTGISIGAVLLIFFVLFFPMLMKGVDKRKYLISVYRGTISSGVFFITDILYKFTEKIGRFYLLISILIVFAVCIILIEIVSLSQKDEKETETRTDITAAIVSGLVFGMLLKLILVGIDYIKHLII